MGQIGPRRWGAMAKKHRDTIMPWVFKIMCNIMIGYVPGRKKQVFETFFLRVFTVRTLCTQYIPPLQHTGIFWLFLSELSE